MAMKFEKMVDHLIGDGALRPSFQPMDGGFSLYTQIRLNDLLAQATNQQNQSVSIQDAAQAA
jgi:hypothetical protein